MSSDAMKLVVVVVNEADSDPLLKGLLEADFRVTRISSSGGFFRKGSSTLLIGVDSARVAAVKRLVRELCSPSLDPGFKKVTLFVLKVDAFVQL